MGAETKSKEERMAEAREELFKLNSRGCGAFDPGLFAITLEQDNSRYLEVKYRVAWFRLVYPKGVIKSSLAQTADTGVLYTAAVYEEPERLLATASAFKAFGTEFSAFESAETAAVGRALSFAGFGTTFCGGELDTGICDAPEKKRLPEAGTEDNPQTAESKAEKPPKEEPANAAKNTKPVKPGKPVKPVKTLQQWYDELPLNLQEAYQMAAKEMPLEEASLLHCPAGKIKDKTINELAKEVNAKEVLDNILKYQYTPKAEEGVQFYAACKKYYKEILKRAAQYDNAASDIKCA